MNIVHITFSFTVGGQENLLVDITNEQVNRSKVSIIVINNRVSKELQKRIHKKVDFITLNRSEGSKSNFLFLFKLWYILLKKKPDVIHCHNPNVINLFPFLKKYSCVTIHDVKEPTGDLKKYRKVFSISKAVKEDLYKSQIFSTVVYNGIDIRSFTRRGQYDLKPDELFRVVQISRLVHEKKGHEVLIKAVELLVHNYHVSNVQLDVIGDGPSREYLTDLVERCQLSKYVHFVGEQDKVLIQQNLHNYHVLVQPSFWEGFGLTVVEGIAAGLPVIASNIDGPAEILADLPAGFLFESGNHEELAKEILKVISYYRNNEIGAFCQESFAKIKSRYSIEETCKSYERHYFEDEILAG